MNTTFSAKGRQGRGSNIGCVEPLRAAALCGLIAAALVGCSGGDPSAPGDDPGGEEPGATEELGAEPAPGQDPEASSGEAAEKDPGADEDRVEIGSTKQASVLGSYSLECGHSYALPTYFFWGLTTALFQNTTPDGSVIHAQYQVGWASSVPIDVSNNPATVQERWAGFGLNVTYVSWSDAAGTYHTCFDNAPNPGAPRLFFETY
jgi:hypothetical protein